MFDRLTGISVQAIAYNISVTVVTKKAGDSAQ